MKRKKTKPRRQWSISEEMRLVDLWPKYIKELRTQKHNGHVYMQIADEMRDAGIQVTHQEISVKLHNLQSRYRKEKSAVGSSKWPLFTVVKNILGFKGNKLELTKEQSISIRELNQSLMGSTPNHYLDPSKTSPWQNVSASAGTSSQCGTSTKKSKASIAAEMFQRMDRLEAETRKSNDLLRETNEQMLAIGHRHNDLLEEMMRDAKEMKKVFIKYLRNSKK